ncbi:DUF1007 family protein [Dongia rigui]|uniref:DUF1007 family protein n=1 Tax=Dongia rigui TaxID=940149 RepID=A0ABU5DSD0_9PROT|nr:DUF1007 family protein [Dongia rigui]MDY0870321.1 DUF1007 family protein [Dongia rigui]
MRWRSVSLLASVVLLLIRPDAALAHPHVFIDNRLAFSFVDGKVTSLQTEWRFDDIFTEDLLGQFDADGDKQFSAAESEQVKEGTLPNLAAFRYFTYIYLDGKDLGKMAPSGFVADVVDGAVRFRLTYQLPHPVDPRQEKLAVSIYDQEYYVEVLLAEKAPVAIDGDAACQAHVADDPAHAYFGGFVVPQIVTIGCP